MSLSWQIEMAKVFCKIVNNYDSFLEIEAGTVTLALQLTTS